MPALPIAESSRSSKLTPEEALAPRLRRKRAYFRPGCSSASKRRASGNYAEYTSAKSIFVTAKKMKLQTLQKFSGPGLPTGMLNYRFAVHHFSQRDDDHGFREQTAFLGHSRAIMLSDKEACAKAFWDDP
ncbi:unnamed protein product, partial [Symbiodinium sp. CCMP2592]